MFELRNDAKTPLQLHPRGSGFEFRIGDEVELRVAGKPLLLEITRDLSDDAYFGRVTAAPAHTAGARHSFEVGRLLRFRGNAVFVRRRPSQDANDGQPASA